MAYTAKSYVDLQGLESFLTRLKAAYAGNDASGSTFTVAKAGQAVNDGAGDEIATKYLTVSTAQNDYVQQSTTIAGVDLQDNITKTELLTALNVADGAQVNVIESVKIKGRAQAETITNGTTQVVIDLDEYAKVADLASLLRFKGTVADETALNAVQNPAEGDVYYVTDGDAEYVWIAGSPGRWELLGPTLDLSAYYTSSEVDSLIADVQADVDAIYKPASGNVAASGYLADEITRATTAEGLLDGRLDTLEGAANVSGSVANSIKTAIEALDVNEVGGSGKMLTTISESDGKISATAVDLVTTIPTTNASTTVPATAAAVKSYVDNAVADVTGDLADLDLNAVGDSATASYVKVVSQTDGQLAATAGAFDTSIPASSPSQITAPTTKAVADGLDAVYGAIESVPLTGATGSISSLFGSST